MFSNHNGAIGTVLGRDTVFAINSPYSFCKFSKTLFKVLVPFEKVHSWLRWSAYAKFAFRICTLIFEPYVAVIAIIAIPLLRIHRVRTTIFTLKFTHTQSSCPFSNQVLYYKLLLLRNFHHIYLEASQFLSACLVEILLNYKDVYVSY